MEGISQSGPFNETTWLEIPSVFTAIQEQLGLKFDSGKLRKKFYRQLLYSEPITPKHQPPPPLKEDTWGVTKEVRQFFNDFEDFADVIASYLLPGKFRGWMAERRIANPPHNPNHHLREP